MHSFENEQCAENYQRILGQPRPWSLTVMAIACHTDLFPGNTAVTLSCLTHSGLYVRFGGQCIIWKHFENCKKQNENLSRYTELLTFLSQSPLSPVQRENPAARATWMPVLPSGIQFSSSVKVGIISRRFPSSSEGTLPTSAPRDFSLSYAISSIHR